MVDIGKYIIATGIFLVLLGVLFIVGFRGLPGDVVIHKGNFTFFFPIVTSIVLSLILSLVLYLLKDMK